MLLDKAYQWAYNRAFYLYRRTEVKYWETHYFLVAQIHTCEYIYIIVLNYDIQDFGSIHYKDFYLYCPEFYPNNCNDKIIDTDES